MKVMVSHKGEGYSIYIPKKDMEADVINIEGDAVFGGTWELEGGMKLFIEPQDSIPKLPLTLVANRA